MLQVFRLLEHVLAEDALEETGGSDRAEQVKMLGTDFLGELHGIARALDIHLELDLGIGLEIVDRRQMEEVRGLLAKLLAVCSTDAEQFLCQVTDHRDGAAAVATPILVDGFQRILLDLADQEVDHAAVALEQLLDQPLADKTGRTGNEVLHCRLLAGFWNQAILEEFA